VGFFFCWLIFISNFFIKSCIVVDFVFIFTNSLCEHVDVPVLSSFRRVYGALLVVGVKNKAALMRSFSSNSYFTTLDRR
jgi:hypothetical protein